MLRPMERREHAIEAAIDRLAVLARTRAGRRTYATWAEGEPALDRWDDAHALAVEARCMHPAEQDHFLEIVLPFAVADELGQLTVIAVVSRGLGAIVAGWAAAGIPAWELDEMEADVVSGGWEAAVHLAETVTAGAPLPARPGQWLVERARDSVRLPRRRQRRAARHHTPLEDIDPVMTMTPTVVVTGARSTCEELAGEIGRAVRQGRLTCWEATPVFLTRVAGFRVGEAAARLGCSDAVLRTRRARAEWRLVAAAACRRRAATC